jgi:alkylated DNA repair protein alkB family protein 1
MYALIGLQIVPSLLPLRTQAALLETLLRRDLSLSETHRTNLHAHYTLPSPCPFFDLSPATTFTPTDPGVHKPLTVSSALTKKLRWVTLGGQYDWTAKRYPDQTPPEFPTDVANLIHGLFPEITPQAAIVNLYAPGDTLAPHRDISEESRKGLASVSIGCSGVFVIGIERKKDEDAEVLAVRLNSGDAVVMSGESRWAWHSVPKILPGTCPPELESWPRGEWEGWMKNKRINLNIRQMWDH